MYFGIGAPKAATSWLGNYLNQHPQVGGNPLKAYHYFNRAFPTHDPKSLDPRPNVPSLLVPIVAGYETRRRVSGYKRGVDKYLTRLVPRSYRSIVRGDQPSCRAFGDVTPAYCMLTAEAFRAMRAANPRTRFFFVMRDPVDRLWSSERMSYRKGYYDRNADPIERLKGFWSEPQSYMRSDYPRTIEELEKAVPQEDILYLFYEDLFTEESISRLTDFLGIDYIPFSNERVNSGTGEGAPLEWKRLAREELATVYDFVNAKFSAEVPAYWNDETRYV